MQGGHDYKIDLSARAVRNTDITMKHNFRNNCINNRRSVGGST